MLTKSDLKAIDGLIQEGLSKKIKAIDRLLDLIEKRITVIEKRLFRIEKHLNLPQVQ